MSERDTGTGSDDDSTNEGGTDATPAADDADAAEETSEKPSEKPAAGGSGKPGNGGKADNKAGGRSGGKTGGSAGGRGRTGGRRMSATQAVRSGRSGSAGRSRWEEARRWAATVVRIGLAAAWFWAGVSKVGDPAEGLRAVRAYRIFPEWAVHAIGYGLPYLEITLAVLLLLGYATRFLAIVSGGLLLLFIGGIASAAARGLRIECGCFGGGGALESGATSYTLDILRDTGLLVLSAALAWWPASRYSMDERAERATQLDRRATRVGPRKTKEAQARVAKLIEKRKEELRRRMRVASIIAAVALVAVAGIGIGIQSERNPTVGNIATPAGSVGEHGTAGIQFGPADAKVTIDVYEDFLCPICKDFEAQSGSTIVELYKGGTAKVRYHTVAFLNRFSTTKYSTRSANAAACTADSKVFPLFHDQLFAGQPPEGSAGLNDNQLIELARGVGANEQEFADCVTDGKYNDWVDAITDAASRAGVTGTPTVLVNGRQVVESNGNPPGPQTLLDAVQTASK